MALALLFGVWSGTARAQTVATYHGAADRGGLYVTPNLSWANAAGMHIDSGFHAVVTGDVYAQPLYWRPPQATTGLVIVATAANIVYGLDGATGAVAWQHRFGAPVSRNALPCGNINPVGIIGTPVIDPALGTLYVAALVGTSAGPRHKIFALALETGELRRGWPVPVQAGLADLHMPFDSAAQGQRGSLTVFDGRLYVAYGGNYGDCSTYHGTVVQVAPEARKLTAAWATRARGGGIWAQSGIAADGEAMFVATGNTMGASQWGDGEAVLRLRHGLAHASSTADWFTPANWQGLDSADADLGGTGPIPLDLPTAGGSTVARLLALGKDGKAYLLDRGNLGGLGGQLAVARVSTSEIVSAAARFPIAGGMMVAFVAPGAACPSGQSGNLTMLRISASGAAPIATAWCASLNGGGAPIITTTDGHSDPIVWVAGAQGDNRLRGFRGTDGVPLFTGGGNADAMAGLRHNATVMVAEGRLFVAGSGRVYAFTH